MVRCDLCKEEVYKSSARKGMMQVHGKEVHSLPDAPNAFVMPTSTLSLFINICEPCSEAMLKEGISGLCSGAPAALRDDWRDNE